jgi:hypothetical protein
MKPVTLPWMSSTKSKGIPVTLEGDIQKSFPIKILSSLSITLSSLKPPPSGFLLR